VKSSADTQLQAASVLYGDEPGRQRRSPRVHRLKETMHADGAWAGQSVIYYSLRDDLSWDEAAEQELLHREDGPAEIWDDGSWRWWWRGLPHRDDGPAVHQLGEDGLWWDQWMQHGEVHRDGDLPATIRSDGERAWWWRGKNHRDGDLPAAIRADGSLEWVQHGQHHREGDRPAKISPDGTRTWCYRGECHREGGEPAHIAADGSKGWWIHGEQHRDQLPACIELCHEIGQSEPTVATFTWFDHGQELLVIDACDDETFALDEEWGLDLTEILTALEEQDLLLPSVEEYPILRPLVQAAS